MGLVIASELLLLLLLLPRLWACLIMGCNGDGVLLRGLSFVWANCDALRSFVGSVFTIFLLFSVPSPS